MYSRKTLEDILFGYTDCIAENIPADGLSPAKYFPGLLGPNLQPPTANSDNSTAPNTRASVAALTASDMIYTGGDGTGEVALRQSYVQWRGQSNLNVTSNPLTPKVNLPMWSSIDANTVVGVSGTQFRQGLSEGAHVEVWVDTLLRHAPLVNVDGLHAPSTSNGIDLLRFTMPSNTLQNATLNPNNAGFNSNQYNGMSNLTAAKKFLPIFMSKPYFLDADAELSASVVGMQDGGGGTYEQRKEKYDTMLDVEPISGITMRAHKRLQVNLRVEAFSFTPFFGARVNLFPNVGVRVLPVVWIDEHGEIDSATAATFKSQVYTATEAKKFIYWGGLLGGCAAVAIAVGILLFATIKARREEKEHHATGHFAHV
jgi:hypothetical protein